MTEKQAYDVVRSYGEFELRRYAPYIVAEVSVQAPFEDAGNAAFRTLLGYISGQNRSATKVAMTAPVLQQPSERIEMTAPVQQRETAEGEFAVAFVLPSSLTLETAPVPTSPDVRLSQRPGVLAAARRYRGGWSRAAFERHRDELENAVRAAGLVRIGPETWARFDPPFMPSFLRRNEVVLEVSEQVPPVPPEG
jgi:hypothetical protein